MALADITPERAATFSARIIRGQAKEQFTLTPEESAAWDELAAGIAETRAQGLTPMIASEVPDVVLP